MNENPTSRRGFIDMLLGGSLAAFFAAALYPVARYMIPPKVPEATLSSVLAANVNELKPNEGKIFKFGRKPGLLIYTPEGEYRAFIATCTHLDCNVQYRSDKKLIWCACHNGSFDLNGINIAGPPPRPLTRLELNIMGEEIYVSQAG